MVLTSIEIMALIVVVISAIKIIFLALSPRKWGSVVKSVYGNRALMTIVSLVLGAVVLNYLLKELTIVQIFASMLFFMFVMFLGVSAYSREIISLYDSIIKNKKIMGKAWLAVLVWMALIIWVLYSIFA